MRADLCDRRILCIVKIERIRMMGRYVIGILMFLTGAMAMAQQQRLRVLVLDSADRAPVANVEVAWSENRRQLTDAEGQVLVEWTGAPTVTLAFSRIGFRSRTVEWTAGRSPRTDPFIVYLAATTTEIDGISVTRPAPERVFDRTDVHAADLLINSEGLWVLAYVHPRLLRAEADAGKEILRDVRLVLLDTLFNEVARCAVPEDVLGLRRDPTDAVIIEGTTRAFSVGRTEEGALVLLPFGLDDLRQRVLPWTDTIPGRVMGSRDDRVIPSVDHLAYDPILDSAQVVCTVVDSFMMELFRSEYRHLKGPEKVVAMNLAADLGVDKEVVAGYMSGFQHNLWFKPVYAPLFVVGDTLLVFDHANARLRKYTKDLLAIGSVPLPYLATNEGKGWSGKLLQDRRTRSIYAIFQRNGFQWLRLVDPVTGSLGERRRITYKYPERVQVHNGSVWYIHRPQESLKKRAIYRERL